MGLGAPKCSKCDHVEEVRDAATAHEAATQQVYADSTAFMYNCPYTFVPTGVKEWLIRR